MSISSINFKPAKSTSESHNLRQTNLDYVDSSLFENNSSWSDNSIQAKEKEIAKLCKSITGRKMQKNAEPIREAVVNLNEGHNIQDLQKLAEVLRNRFKIDCFQIHIHRDEGLIQENGERRINHHAHMIFDWQDKETGKTLKLDRLQFSQIQTVVAESLSMERGKLKSNTNRERLEPLEFKVQQESIRLESLHQQNAELEQKKNEVRARIAVAESERNRIEEAYFYIEEALSGSDITSEFPNVRIEYDCLSEQIEEAKRRIEAVKKQITAAEQTKKH
jgi:hypothetical protein